MIRAVIKVGKSSKLKLHNVKAFRAITYAEAVGMVEGRDNIGLVVIDGMKDAEKARMLVESAGNHGIHVAVVESDSEKADACKEALGLDCLTDIKQLQSHIAEVFGEEVSTFVKSEKEKEEEHAELESELNEMSDSAQESMEEEIQAIEESEPEEAEEVIEEIAFTEEEMTEDEMFNSAGFSEYDDDIGEYDEAGDYSSDEGGTEEEKVAVADITNTEQYTRMRTELLSKLEEARKQADNSEAKLDMAHGQIEKLRDIKKSLQSELAYYKDQLNSLDLVAEVTEVQVGDVQFNSEEVQAKIEELEKEAMDAKIETSNAEARLREAEGDIKQLQKDLESEQQKHESDLAEKDSQIQKLQSELEEARDNTELDTAKRKLNAEINARLDILELVEELMQQLEASRKESEHRRTEVGKLLTESKRLQSELDSKEELVEQLEEKYDKAVERDTEKIKQSNAKILSLTQKISDMQMEASDRQQEIDMHSLKVQETEIKMKGLRGELKSTREALDSTKIALQKRNEELEVYRSQNIDQMTENIAELESSNNLLTQKVGQLSRDLDMTEQELASKKKEIANLGQENLKLKTTAKSLTSVNLGSGGVKLQCAYKGTGTVIGVLGSGSFGVTTTVVSLAKRLPGSVLVMDFDIVGPKLDGWFQKSPLIKSLPDIDIEMKKTSLGALIERGTDYVFDHQSEVIQNIAKSKKTGYKIDYFSGAYTKVDMYKLMAVDFSQLFTYLGNEYDYIVADLGRLGGSDTSASIIKMFDSFASKSIYVALHDRTDIRSMALRTRNEGLDIKKSLWMLNMSKRTKMDDIMKKAIGSSGYVIMPAKMEIYGEMKSMDMVGVLKDRLGELIELIEKR